MRQGLVLQLGQQEGPDLEPLAVARRIGHRRPGGQRQDRHIEGGVRAAKRAHQADRRGNDAGIGEIQQDGAVHPQTRGTGRVGGRTDRPQAAHQCRQHRRKPGVVPTDELRSLAKHRGLGDLEIVSPGPVAQEQVLAVGIRKHQAERPLNAHGQTASQPGELRQRPLGTGPDPDKQGRPRPHHFPLTVLHACATPCHVLSMFSISDL